MRRRSRHPAQMMRKEIDVTTEHTKKWIGLLLGMCILCLLTACARPTIPYTTKLEKFPLMYEENPVVILILPPINETTAADAREYYSTTIQQPLAFAGFYTLSYPITADILRMEGIYDSELIVDMPLARFREFFGADAVLFTTIHKWDLAYRVVTSHLTVSISCQLKSTHSDRMLWEYSGTVVQDLTAGDMGGGLGGLVIRLAVTAAQSAMADYVPYAQIANYRTLSTIPYGRYHVLHNQDQGVQLVDQKPEDGAME